MAIDKPAASRRGSYAGSFMGLAVLIAAGFAMLSVSSIDHIAPGPQAAPSAYDAYESGMAFYGLAMLVLGFVACAGWAILSATSRSRERAAAAGRLALSARLMRVIARTAGVAWVLACFGGIIFGRANGDLAIRLFAFLLVAPAGIVLWSVGSSTPGWRLSPGTRGGYERISKDVE